LISKVTNSCVSLSYFVSVGWESYDLSYEIPGVTYLFEIKDLNNIKINYLSKKCSSVN